MTQNGKTPVEKAVDLLVYAPIGVASLARTMLPSILEQSRQKVEARVTQARVLGQFAIQQGQYELNKISGQVKQQVDTRSTTEPAEAPAEPEPATAEAPPVEPAPIEDAPPVEELAIPGYDSLSASQVVPRLNGLDGLDLDAVRRYEAATRGRKTILNRISQLQSQG